MTKKSTLAIVVCLIAVCASAGCGGNNKPADASKSALTNSELESRVRDKLESDQEISAAHLFIEPAAEKQQVTLSGTLKSEDLHNKAIDLAQSAQPGIAVIDNIQVDAPQVTAKSKAGKKATPKGRAAKKPGKRNPTR